MSINEQVENSPSEPRIKVRKPPLCYSRPVTVDSEQARVDAQFNSLLVVLGVVTCAAAFLVAHSG